MSAEPSLSPPPIDYAPPDPRRRRLIRRLATAAFLLLLLSSTYWVAPLIWHRVEVAYWYNRCLSYRAPNGTVIEQMRGGGRDWPRKGPAYVPNEWRRLYGMISPPGFQSDGTAFLGERRMPNGTKVLVAVDVALASPWATFTEASNLALHVRLFAADTSGSSSPRQILDTLVKVPVPDIDLAVLAGSADPNDPTRFTIPFRFENTQGGGVIDGWVQDDGVKFDGTYPADAGRSTSRRLPASRD
jgi:hypothetical protein